MGMPLLIKIMNMNTMVIISTMNKKATASFTSREPQVPRCWIQHWRWRVGRTRRSRTEAPAFPSLARRRRHTAAETPCSTAGRPQPIATPARYPPSPSGFAGIGGSSFVAPRRPQLRGCPGRLWGTQPPRRRWPSGATTPLAATGRNRSLALWTCCGCQRGGWPLCGWNLLRETPLVIFFFQSLACVGVILDTFLRNIRIINSEVFTRVKLIWSIYYCHYYLVTCLLQCSKNSYCTTRKPCFCSWWIFTLLGHAPRNC